MPVDPRCNALDRIDWRSCKAISRAVGATLLAESETDGHQLGSETGALQAERGVLPPGAHRAAMRDLIVAFVLFGVTVAAFIWFDFFERFFEYSRRHEDWELDEFVSAVPALALVTAWFAIRRWRETALVTSRLEASLDELTATTSDLDAALEREEQASHVKSVFLSMMSDEIRTPMNGVIRPVEALLESGLGPAQHEQALGALRASRSLLQSINDILELAALETGPASLTLDRFKAEELLDDVERYFNEHRSDRVELSFFIDPVLPAALVGDAPKLQRILLILVENALKFTPFGGIAVALRVAQHSRDGLLLHFDVTDTGTGIEPEHRSTVFDSFTRPIAPDERVRPGTGIGLAICKRLVGDMGGQIGVESEPGEGSRFWFTLPLSRGSEPLDVHAEKAFENLCVLVVDDEELNRDTLAAQISAWGATVETASLGMEAIATLRKGVEGGLPFDVALIDAGIESGGGQTLIEQIRDDTQLLSLNVILADREGTKTRKPMINEPNILAILDKPVRTKHLQTCLLAVSATKAPRTVG